MLNKIILHACCAVCATYPIALLKKEGYYPIIYFDNPNIYPYEEYTYGPVVKNQKELEKAILNPNDYSQKKEKFQKKFMSSCDGKSTKRFVEQLLGGKS